MRIKKYADVDVANEHSLFGLNAAYFSNFLVEEKYDSRILKL
jgi:hypothetical protein